MPEYTEFPQENIDKALALARRSFEGVDLQSTDMLSPQMALRAGPADFNAGCIGVISQDNQVCLQLPVVGNLCVPVDLPDGSVAEACVVVCTHWGIPTGICLTIRALGNNIFRQCYGWC
jgi:hypothetical protein